jgi:hypothetical protein
MIRNEFRNVANAALLKAELALAAAEVSRQRRGRRQRSYREIATELAAIGLMSASGKPFWAESVKRIVSRVNLLFPDQPILLDLVSLERKAPHVVRIIGHTVKPTKKGMA